MAYQKKLLLLDNMCYLGKKHSLFYSQLSNIKVIKYSAALYKIQSRKSMFCPNIVISVYPYTTMMSWDLKTLVMNTNTEILAELGTISEVNSKTCKL